MEEDEGLKYYYELVEYDEGLPAKVLLQNKPGWRCDTMLHWHKEIELVYMISGKLNYNISGKDGSVSDGEMYLVNSEEVHVTNAPYKDAMNKYLVLLLSYDFISDYNKNPQRIEFDLSLSGEATGFIIQRLKRLYDLYDKREEAYDLFAHGEIMQIYAMLIKFCASDKKSTVSSSGDNAFNYAKKAIEYMGTHFKDDITLGDISDYVGLSPAYFSKCFKDITECNFRQFLNLIRLEHALNDMFYANSTVTESAMNNGFPNTKSFINLCKSKFGYTPTQYKKMMTSDKNK